MYPNQRNRRLRESKAIRALVRENQLSVNDLMLPLFVTEGRQVKEAIHSMPGIYRYSVDRLSEILDKAISNKIPMVSIFPYTNQKLKNLLGSEALNENNLVCKSILYVE